MSVRGVGVLLGIGNSVAGGAVSGLLVVAAVRNLELSDDSPAIGALFATTAVGALAASWLIGPCSAGPRMIAACTRMMGHGTTSR